MSCYPVAQEITSICADYLVADAVLRNWSHTGNSLFSAGIRELFSAAASSKSA
jgi:hypothetical protein